MLDSEADQVQFAQTIWQFPTDMSKFRTAVSFFLHCDVFSTKELFWPLFRAPTHGADVGAEKSAALRQERADFEAVRAKIGQSRGRFGSVMALFCHFPSIFK